VRNSHAPGERMGNGLRRLIAQFVTVFPQGAASRRCGHRAGRGAVGGNASTTCSPAKCFASIARVSCVAVLAGCAVAPSGPAQNQPAPRDSVAVIPLGYAPAPMVSLTPPRQPPSSGELAVGAAASAGAVALGALAIAATPFGGGGGALLILQGLGGLAGTAAAAAGAGTSPGPEGPQVAIARALSPALVGLPLAELSANAAVGAITAFTPYRAEVIEDPGAATGSAAADYTTLRQRGFTHALEIRMTQAGLIWPGSRSLGVLGVARLIDTKTGATTRTKSLFYSAAGDEAEYWLRDQAAPARREFQRAARVLGERAVEALLLGAETADPWLASETCGLAVIDPAPLWSRLMSESRSAWTLTGPSPAGSLTPSLAWEPPPVPPFVANPWASAEKIRYDLRIWNSEDEVPQQLVYERNGLTEARHQVEAPLAPRSLYFWSVRMRGTIAGSPRSTPWSMARSPAFVHPVPSGLAEGDRLPPACPGYACGCLDFIPLANFYRFRTP